MPRPTAEDTARLVARLLAEEPAAVLAAPGRQGRVLPALRVARWRLRLLGPPFWVASVVLLLLGAVLALFVQLPDRGSNLAKALEGGLPLVAALLAAPLLLGEGERDTLCWLATRASLVTVVATRLALLALYLLALCALALVTAHVLWGSPVPWAALPRAAAPALAFAALALLTAHWGHTTVHGYLPVVALWAGVLLFSALLPHCEPWLTLNPFAWSNCAHRSGGSRNRWQQPDQAAHRS